jgi:hypothetical protein
MAPHLRTLHPLTCAMVLAACAALTFLALREMVGDTSAATRTTHGTPQPKAIRNLAGEQPKQPEISSDDTAATMRKRKPAAKDPLKEAARQARARARRQLAHLRKRKPLQISPAKKKPPTPVQAPPPSGQGTPTQGGGTTTPKIAPAPAAPSTGTNPAVPVPSAANGGAQGPSN